MEQKQNKYFNLGGCKKPSKKFIRFHTNKLLHFLTEKEGLVIVVDNILSCFSNSGIDSVQFKLISSQISSLGLAHLVFN